MGGMDTFEILAPEHEGKVERSVVSVKDYCAAAERARVLARLVEEDPHDEHALHALEELRRDGFDVDVEFVLGFTPADLMVDTRPVPLATVAPEEALCDEALDEDREWVLRLMSEAVAFANVGLADRALERLEVVLRMDPTNDIARARLFALTADQVEHLPGRGDETLRIACR